MFVGRPAIFRAVRRILATALQDEEPVSSQVSTLNGTSLSEFSQRWLEESTNSDRGLIDLWSKGVPFLDPQLLQERAAARS